jgi:hypothetical protein
MGESSKKRMEKTFFHRGEGECNGRDAPSLTKNETMADWFRNVRFVSELKALAIS